MNRWIMLGIAILAEVIATSALKASDNLTRFWPVVIVVLGYGIAFFCLSVTIRTVPVGIAYALWSGVGIVLITAAGWVLYDQRMDAPALAGLGLIIAGVAVINLFSDSAGH